MRRRNLPTLTPYLLLLPAFVVITVILIYPIITVAMTSFYRIELYKYNLWLWVGIGNYLDAFRDPIFYKALTNTALYVLATNSAQFSIGLFLAVILNQKGMRFVGFFRGIYIMPWVMSSLIVGYSWRFIFLNPGGLASTFVGLFGIPEVPWLGQDLALFSVTIANIWQGTAFSLLMMSAGLVSIPEHLYEAALVDGASRIQRFMSITVPNLKSFILIDWIMMTLWCSNVFDSVMVLTNGGPLYSSEVFALYMWRNAFRFGMLGYGSALALILFVVTFTFTFLYVKSVRIEAVV
jgi:multiple sugar transport system permease protein